MELLKNFTLTEGSHKFVFIPYQENMDIRQVLAEKPVYPIRVRMAGLSGRTHKLACSRPAKRGRVHNSCCNCQGITLNHSERLQAATAKTA